MPPQKKHQHIVGVRVAKSDRIGIENTWQISSLWRLRECYEQRASERDRMDIVRRMCVRGCLKCVSQILCGIYDIVHLFRHSLKFTWIYTSICIARDHFVHSTTFSYTWKFVSVFNPFKLTNNSWWNNMVQWPTIAQKHKAIWSTSSSFHVAFLGGGRRAESHSPNCPHRKQ